ncbi:MAG: hypothetical protein R2856_16100 [Caldilineaceae bacterium]
MSSDVLTTVRTAGVGVMVGVEVSVGVGVIVGVGAPVGVEVGVAGVAAAMICGIDPALSIIGKSTTGGSEPPVKRSTPVKSIERISTESAVTRAMTA